MSDLVEPKTGVYCWRTRINGKVYVGSAAVSLLRRLSDYRCALPRGKCHNPYLQHAWNKYGAKSFVFCILEHCVPELCVEREQYWMDFYKSYNPEFGYNISPTAGNALGVKWSDASKQKASKIAKVIANTLEGKKQRSDRAKRMHADGRLNGRKVKPPRPKICVTCNEEFVPIVYDTGHKSGSKYCEACKPIHYGGHYKKLVNPDNRVGPRMCRDCGNEASTKHSKFCDECRRNIKSLAGAKAGKTMKGRSYNSTHWTQLDKAKGIESASRARTSIGNPSSKTTTECSSSSSGATLFDEVSV